MIFKNKAFVATMIFLAAIAGMVFGVIGPILANIKQANGKIESENQNIASYDRRVQAVKQFKEFYAQKGNDFKKIDGLFVDAQMPSAFIDFLGAAARRYGLAIKLAPSPRTRAAGDAWDSITFQVELAGDFPSIMRFLASVESSDYLAEVQNFQINTREAQNQNAEGGTVPALKAVFLLKAYAK